MTHILLVEDEADQRELVAGVLASAGYQVTQAGSVEEALPHLEQTPFDLILSDWKLPGRDGLSFLKEVRERLPHMAFIMVTAYGSIANAVEAIREGADDYLSKPYQREALLLAVEKAHGARRLVIENRRLTEELDARERLVDLIGASSGMAKLFRRIEKVAGADVTVLINGESGTGKELTARALHALSKRAQKPFVAVNCAAIPEGLIEAEFFGAERGAYTGSDRTRTGKFQQADGGTLFLDEIGELPVAMQPKLLRVLQEGVVTSIGGARETKVDVRILTATNRDLKTEVQEGRFREDLFYRLNVVPVTLPPLRERREDIPKLVAHFVEQTNRRYSLSFREFPKNILRQFMSYTWPGNVRELMNVVERLILLADEDQVSTEDLPPEMLETTALGGVRFTLPPEGFSWERHERDCLNQAMTLANNNRTKAAKLLDLPYKAFLYRLEKHGLT